jgi:hypothetical protein
MTKVEEMRIRVAEAQDRKANCKKEKAKKFADRIMENAIRKAADKGKTSIRIKIPMFTAVILVNKYLRDEGFTVETQTGIFRTPIKISWIG